MHPLLRNILSLIAGLLIGGLFNLGIIAVGGKLLPPPQGVDVNDVASINAHIHEYSFVQMMVPFLAHALGTLMGALAAAKLAASHRMLLAMVIGGLTLLGGIGAVMMIPAAPWWFDVLDLGVAYLPMAWLGAKLGSPKT